MLASLELGRRIGKRRLREDAHGAQAGIAAVEAAVFGLMGLLLAFTFSGAWTRFDARRDLILAEAKAIGSGWQRADLLAPNDREVMRTDLRTYLDLRLGSTRAGATKADTATAALQGRLWSRALAAAQNDVRLVQGFLPVIDQMFDVATARYVAAGAHPP